MTQEVKNNDVVVASIASKLISYGNVSLEIVKAANGKVPRDTLNDLIDTAYHYILGCKNKKVQYDYHESRQFIEAYVEDPEACKNIWAIMTMFCFENAIHKTMSQNLSTSQWQYADSVFNLGLNTVYQAAQNYSPLVGTTFLSYVCTSLSNNIKHEVAMNINKQNNLGGGTSQHHAKESAIISNNLNMDSEELARMIYEKDLAEALAESPEKYDKMLQRRVRRVEKLKRNFSTPIISINMPIGEDGDEFGAMIADETDIAEEYYNKEQENIIATKFIPIIAEIYGDDSAYVTLLRTGILWGYQKISFYKMEDMYSQYLVTKKKLTQLSDEVPNYKQICDKLKHCYAVSGKAGYLAAIKNTPEEYLFRNLLVEADKEAKELAEGDRKSSECFKLAGSLNYMFGKVFPVKTGVTFSDKDKRNAARFRKELRDIGMDEVANKLFTMFAEE